MNHTVQLSPFERDLLKFSIIKFGKLNKCAKLSGKWCFYVRIKSMAKIFTTAKTKHTVFKL